MTYIYLDESGDLVFGKRGRPYFVITCVKIDDEKVNEEFCRIPKKVRQQKLKKHQKIGELKFSNSNDQIREAFLKRAAKLPLEIYSVVVSKEKTNHELQRNLPILYNYLIKILLEAPLFRIKNKLHLMICLDRAMSRSQRENFETYIKTQFLSIFQQLPKVEIRHESSEYNSCLQVIDFICGAFGYKYNTKHQKDDCERYVEIIKDKIIIERKDLFR